MATAPSFPVQVANTSLELLEYFPGKKEKHIHCIQAVLKLLQQLQLDSNVVSELQFRKDTVPKSTLQLLLNPLWFIVFHASAAVYLTMTLQSDTKTTRKELVNFPQRSSAVSTRQVDYP